MGQPDVAYLHVQQRDRAVLHLRGPPRPASPPRSRPSHRSSR
jgi:hypothetical protein